MGDETNSHPTWRDYESMAKHLGEVVRANTNTLRLVHAVQVAGAKSIAEAVSLCAELKGSSGAAAERVAGKLDLIIEVARNADRAAKDALAESRATNDRLGVTREEIGALRRDLTPAHGVPLLQDPTRDSPPEGITLKHGNVNANVKLERMKRLLPWLGPIIGGAGWHFLRHFFGL